MGLTADIVHDSRNKVQHLAVITGVRIRNIDDVQAAELFDGGYLRRIDGGGRFHHVHYFAHLLLMRKRHFQVSSGWELHRRQSERVVILLLHVDPVGARGKVQESAAAGKVSLASQARKLRGAYQHTRCRHCYPVFIDDRNEKSEAGLG